MMLKIYNFVLGKKRSRLRGRRRGRAEVYYRAEMGWSSIVVVE